MFDRCQSAGIFTDHIFWMTNEMFAGGLEVDVELKMTRTPGSSMFSQRFTFFR